MGGAEVVARPRAEASPGAGAARRRGLGPGAAGKALVYLVLIPASALFLFPIAWSLSTSLKGTEQTFADPPVWIPSPIAWENYPRGWTLLNFTRFLVNTLVISGLSLVGTILSSSIVAFGFARLRARGRNLLFALALATLMIPSQATIVPTFILFYQLGWLDTILPLTVPSFFAADAFFVFLLRQFMLTITTEIDDAARIDGCGGLGIYWYIVMPLLKPALAAVAIFSFVSNWNDFFGPLIFLRAYEHATLALGLRFLQMNPRNVDLEGTLAVSLLVLVPEIVVFFFAQKQFIQGITLTGVKG